MEPSRFRAQLHSLVPLNFSSLPYPICISSCPGIQVLQAQESFRGLMVGALHKGASPTRGTLCILANPEAEAVYKS